jgi:hypothetical protein
MEAQAVPPRKTRSEHEAHLGVSVVHVLVTGFQAGAVHAVEGSSVFVNLTVFRYNDGSQVLQPLACSLKHPNLAPPHLICPSIKRLPCSLSTA